MKRKAERFYHYLISEKRVADNTFQAYRRDINQYLTFTTGNSENEEKVKHTNKEVRSFLKYLKQEKKVSAQTLSRKLSALKTFGTYLEDYHDIENFTQGVVFPKLPKRLPKHLSEKHISQMLQVAAQDNSIAGKRNQVIFSLLYMCGVRVSELINISISHINFDEQVLHIFGKGSKERIVPLPKEMMILLYQYLQKIHPKLIESSSSKKNKQLVPVLLQTDYLFPIVIKNKVMPISRKLVWKIVKNLALEAGIMHATSPHTLRHSLATHLLKKGTNLRLLQMLLGHEQIDTVQVYTHLDISHLRKLYDAMHPRAK